MRRDQACEPVSWCLTLHPTQRHGRARCARKSPQPCPGRQSDVRVHLPPLVNMAILNFVARDSIQCIVRRITPRFIRYTKVPGYARDRCANSRSCVLVCVLCAEELHVGLGLVRLGSLGIRRLLPRGCPHCAARGGRWGVGGGRVGEEPRRIRRGLHVIRVRWR